MSEPLQSAAEGSGETRKGVLRRYRRDSIKRATTANQIALFDFLTSLVAIGTLAWHDSAATLGWVGWVGQIELSIPRSLILVSCLVLMLRGFLLTLFTGRAGVIVRSIAESARRLQQRLDAALDDREDDANERPEAYPRVQSRVTIATIEGRTSYWYFLVGVGALAQVALVAGSGGMAASPFAQMLTSVFHEAVTSAG